jgi:hypothetical protein
MLLWELKSSWKKKKKRKTKRLPLLVVESSLKKLKAEDSLKR